MCSTIILGCNINSTTANRLCSDFHFHRTYFKICTNTNRRKRCLEWFCLCLQIATLHCHYSHLSETKTTYWGNHVLSLTIMGSRLLMPGHKLRTFVKYHIMSYTDLDLWKKLLSVLFSNDDTHNEHYFV